MKSIRTITWSLPVLAIILFMANCQKTPLDSQPNAVHASYIDLDNDYTGVSESDGILWFDDLEAFAAVMTQLDGNYNDWNDAFEAEYAELDDDEFNATAEEEEYMEEQALLDFEDQFDYTSLRNILSALQDEWLEEGNFDPNNDPDDHYVQDEILRTLLNEYAEIAIGESIYKIYEEEVFEITDGDMSTLEGIREDPEEYREAENVVVHDYSEGSGKSAVCKNWGFVKEHPGQGNKYHYIAKLSFRNYPFYSVIVAKSKAYKNSKRNKTSQSVQIYGSIYNPGCSSSSTVGSYKSKRRKVVRVRIPKWGGTGGRSYNESLHSNHTTYGNTETLDN